MILKVTCPSCSKAYRLSPPYPPSGRRYRCTCGRVITISYPTELIEALAVEEAVKAQAPKPPPSPTDSTQQDGEVFTSGQHPTHAEPSSEPDVEASAPSVTVPPPSVTVPPPSAATSSQPEEAEEEQATQDEPSSHATSPLQTPGPDAPASPETPPEPLLRAPAPDAPEALAPDRAVPSPTLAPADTGMPLKAPAPSPDMPQAPASAHAERSSARPDPPEDAPEPALEPPARAVELQPEAAPTHTPLVEPDSAALDAEQRPVRAAAADDNTAPAPVETQPEQEPTEPPAPISPPVSPRKSRRRAQDQADTQEKAPKAPRRRVWTTRKLLISFALGLLTLLAAASVAVGVTVATYSQGLPPLDTLQTYRPALVSQVFARDGRLIGEFYGEERRYLLTYEQIPPLLVQAFVSAEDGTFFEHVGVDPRSIARAFVANLRESRVVQGGSTITQQVARSFLLGRERTLERKVQEALLAMRIEESFSKEQILTLYLNQIYLGEGAYGVEAAARVYFGRGVETLTLAELAMLAGLPPAPSRYSPIEHFKEAKARQAYVLRNMAARKVITEAQAQEAQAAEVRLQPRHSINRELAPFVIEHVRRYLEQRYGADAVFKGGLKVTTTLDLDLQLHAQNAVKEGVEQVDHRMGWRGPAQKISLDQLASFATAYEKAMWKQRWEARPGGEDRYGPPPDQPLELAEGEVVQGVAVTVQDKVAVVRVGRRVGVLPLENMKWGYAPDLTRSWKGRSLDRVARVLSPGDVIQVRVKKAAYEGRHRKLFAPNTRRGETDQGRWTEVAGAGALPQQPLELELFQEPQLEGALFAYETGDGSVIAMVGGYDFARSQFIRPMQAKRQMGSAFKPLIYSAALDHPVKVYTASTQLLDAPIVIDSGAAELWKPSNYDETFLGPITLRRALYLSRNTPAVRVLQDIGPDYAAAYVRKLGFTSPINEDFTMVLGTPSVTLVEMCRAFSAFADRGQLVEPVFVTRVEDREARVLEQRAQQPLKTQVMPPTTAFIMTSILQDVVQHGTATKALVLDKPTAGKTGTTNEFVDASYIGFTPKVVAGTWVGFDQPRSMGAGATGGDTALPIWVEFMKQGLIKYPETEPATPPNIEWIMVDPSTGAQAGPASRGAVRLPFVQGRLPSAPAAEPGQVAPSSFLSEDGDLSLPPTEPSSREAAPPAPAPAPAIDAPPLTDPSDEIPNR